MAIGTGTGTTVTFGTSGFTGNIMNVSQDGISRPSVDTSHMGTTTARTFTPGDLYDGGEITLSVQWDPAAATKPPISAAAETITIAFKGGANTAQFSGFVTEYGNDIPMEELMMTEITIKVSGVITYA